MRASRSFAIASVAALVNAVPLLAQCPLCRTALSSLGSEAARAFNRAILILLLPAVALFCGVFSLIFKRRDTTDAESSKQ